MKGISGVRCAYIRNNCFCFSWDVNSVVEHGNYVVVAELAPNGLVTNGAGIYRRLYSDGGIASYTSVNINRESIDHAFLVVELEKSDTGWPTDNIEKCVFLNHFLKEGQAEQVTIHCLAGDNHYVKYSDESRGTLHMIKLVADVNIPEDFVFYKYTFLNKEFEFSFPYRLEKGKPVVYRLYIPQGAKDLKFFAEGGLAVIPSSAQGKTSSQNRGDTHYSDGEGKKKSFGERIKTFLKRFGEN